MDLLRLYPSQWRARYGAEMADLLEARPPDRRDRLDLVRGAVDAHLHPATPSAVPALAALLAGACWTVMTLAVLAEPTLPDWPGYLAPMLPVGLLGATAGMVASLGFALRLGDEPGRRGTIATIVLACGYVAWMAALLMAILGGPYGALTGAAATLASLGSVILGMVLLRAGRHPHGEILVGVGAGSLLLPPLGWIVLAGLWTATGLWLLVQRAGQSQQPGAIA